MVETQWLLSALAPRDRYLSLSGSRLTGTRTRSGTKSRSDTEELARATREEFDSIRRSGPERANYETPDQTLFAQSMSALRGLLGISVTDTDKIPDAAEPPSIHTVGYSLGGFVAQSIFMTWPYLVAGCVTVCSGGALEEITPVSFAHPEEWQTLTHSLRYRLDDLMLSVATRTEGGDQDQNSGDPLVFGLRAASFDYFKRVFYEIFEQEYRVSYQTRIAEYLQRVLFVVGGNDPVITPSSVLDAAPTEGANVIEVGGLSHFVSSSKLATGKLETEQRDFWFPEIARLVARWAPEAERVLRRSVQRGWRKTDNTGFVQQSQTRMGSNNLTDKERASISPNGGVGSPIFERLLDAMTVQVGVDFGSLFILRNEIPTFMLADEYHVYRAKALHHSEDLIRAYLEGIAARRAKLLEYGRGITIVVPSDAVSKLRATFLPGLSPATSEIPVGEYFDPEFRSAKEIADYVARDFEDRWITNRNPSWPQLWLFYPGQLSQSGQPLDGEPVDGSPNLLGSSADVSGPLGRFGRFVGNESVIDVERLPDCWMRLAPRECLDFEIFSEDWSAKNNIDLHREAARNLVLNTVSFVADAETAKRRHRAPDQWLNTGVASAMVIARARYNPRHRGQVVLETRDLAKVVIHSALSFLRSEQR